MAGSPPATLHVEGRPYQYEVEADAGVWLSSGTRWWGTRLRWRAGITGRWHTTNLVDVHPFDHDAVTAALELIVRGR